MYFDVPIMLCSKRSDRFSFSLKTLHFPDSIYNYEIH